MKKIPIFAFAGLYDVWHDASGEGWLTYTIITTEANDMVAPLNDRMPVILEREDEDRWLSGLSLSHDKMNEILRPYSAEEMDAYAVSSWVNGTTIDDERLILPLETL